MKGGRFRASETHWYSVPIFWATIRNAQELLAYAASRLSQKYKYPKIANSRKRCWERLVVELLKIGRSARYKGFRSQTGQFNLILKL